MKVLSIGLLSILLMSCGQSEKATSSPDFVIDTLMTPPGHETITRLALIEANRLFGENFYPVPEEDDGSCKSSRADAITQGNCQTDKGEGFIGYLYNSNGSFSDWQNRQDLSPLHFLRNADDAATRNSRYASCKAIRDSMTLRSKLALRSQRDGIVNWNGNISNGSFVAHLLIGSVTHTIQDGFSKAHVIRDSSNIYQMNDICTYGAELPSVCEHSTISFSDFVDVDAPEERVAIEASAAYLRLMAYGLRMNQTEINLDSFFDIYFACW